MERVRPCLHEGNELCYNFIKTVTWECRHHYSYLGADFLTGSHYPWFSEGTGPLITSGRRGSPVEPGSRSGQRELCGPAKEPRNPPELSSSAGQWKWVDPGSDEPFRCYACKAATMNSSLTLQSLKFYECKAWRTEVLNWLRSRLFYHCNHKSIHGLVQAV